MGLLGGRTDPTAFWAWFGPEAARRRGPEDLDAAFLADLRSRLRTYGRRLDHEIGLRPATDELELVVSADGRSSEVPRVEALVAAAPDIPGWRVTALRPARDVAGTAVRVGDETVAADDVVVAVSGGGDAVVLTAWVRDLDRNVADRMRAAHLLVEHALGERTLVERVVAFDWQSYDGAAPAGTVPLTRLRAALPD